MASGCLCKAVDPDADGAAVHRAVVQLGARRLCIRARGEAYRAKAPAHSAWQTSSGQDWAHKAPVGTKQTGYEESPMYF